MLEELDRQLYINLGYVFLESQNLRQQKKRFYAHKLARMPRYIRKKRENCATRLRKTVEKSRFDVSMWHCQLNMVEF